MFRVSMSRLIQAVAARGGPRAAGWLGHRAWPWSGSRSNAGLRTRGGSRILGALCLLAGLSMVANGAPASADTGGGTWAATGRMHDGRAYQTATQLPSGDVLVTGGSSGIYIKNGPSPSLASSELYHPATGRWTQTGAMDTARQSQTATLLPDGLVLAAGGFDCTDTTCATLATAELYDPTTGAWSLTGSLVSARALHTATLLPDGHVLLAGGLDANFTASAGAELYDPATGTSTATGSLHDARAAATATLLPDGRVLVAGGFDATGADQASAEVYDPASGAWTLTGSLGTARDSATATLLPSGQVLVAGGYDAAMLPLTPALASTELYSPSSGLWTSTASLHVARDQHTATLLPNGQVLVAGGYGNHSPGPMPSAELYDPATGTWRLTAPMDTGRSGQTATVLPNGKVLVAGGSSDSLRRLVLASAELYTP